MRPGEITRIYEVVALIKSRLGFRRVPRGLVDGPLCHVVIRHDPAIPWFYETKRKPSDQELFMLRKTKIKMVLERL